MLANNRRRLTQHARQLRQDQTLAEQKLWSRLRNRQLLKHKFRRQHVLGAYIVDFVCLERRLVLELDGGKHLEPQALSYDQVRTRWLNQQGFFVLRFFDNQVLSELDAVLLSIATALERPPPAPLQGASSPAPSSRERRPSRGLRTHEISVVGKLRMVTTKPG